MEPMDRLVGLFLQAALQDDTPQKLEGGLPPEAVERGIHDTEKMLTSDDAIKMGMAGLPAPTFVCLAMALEEKPNLQHAALRCYERALHHLLVPRGSWERIVVLQQLGAVSLRHGKYNDAARWLAECGDECQAATGHPRDAHLFEGSFNTNQTRMEFMSMVEKMRAQTCHRLGDMVRATEHMKEAKRLEQLVTGDAVQRTASSSGIGTSTSSIAIGPVADLKQLWQAAVDDPTRLKRYSFTDEGPTVLLMLNLNEHLEIGDEASSLVESLKQFRVNCEEHSVDIRLRVRRSGQIREFRLLLHPLAQEIVPEDTVPKLKCREGKRRLEVKLFKRDRTRTWYGDLVKSGAPPTKQSTSNQAVPAKGSQLNPLTPEELAKLPRPNGSGVENMPSAWRNSATDVAVGGSAEAHFVAKEQSEKPAQREADSFADALEDMD